MRKRVAIIGSGPTAIFALQNLITCRSALEIEIFEAMAVAGKGTPYQRGMNDPAMLSNIGSIEIPRLPETLTRWLVRQADEYLDQFDLKKDEVSERAFYPRVVIGDYFRSQFETIVHAGREAKHSIKIVEECRVVDIKPSGHRFQLATSRPDIVTDTPFDFVIAAIGHLPSSQTKKSPDFFETPWSAPVIKSTPSGNIGVLGTSLSAIDTVVTLATSFGEFQRDGGRQLRYRPSPKRDFKVVMMSRKGLLPEADFYFPIPHIEPDICTREAICARLALGSAGLLDHIFELFRQELKSADPQYAEAIGLDHLTVDTFAAAYYGLRDKSDPFEWAVANLNEAKRNYENRHTVPWRYSILIMHEVIESAVRYLNANDLKRFNASFKSIFSDDYATVPHLSIERILALHQADRLEIISLGNSPEVSFDGAQRGGIVRFGTQTLQFETLIDATGQKCLSANDVPFPSLVDRRLISEARTVTPNGSQRRTGGIDVDAVCRPLSVGAKPVRGLYFPAIPYLLHKRPFVQGLTSAAELGQTVATSIIAEVTRPERSKRQRLVRRTFDKCIATQDAPVAAE